jgi:hypothetical protein
MLAYILGVLGKAAESRERVAGSKSGRNTISASSGSQNVQMKISQPPRAR